MTPEPDPEEELDYGPYADLIPEGAFPEMGFRVVGYLNENGTPILRDDWVGNVPIGHTFGVVMLALIKTWHERMHEQDVEH